MGDHAGTGSGHGRVRPAGPAPGAFAQGPASRPVSSGPDMGETGGMLVTNHVLSGAVVGALAGNPLLAFPLGVLSHLALDATPHWGRWETRAEFLRIARTDGLTGLAAMAALAAAAEPRQRTAVIAGMVGAALPDLNKPGKLFFGRSPFPARFDALHRRIQDGAAGRFWSHEVPSGVVFAAGFGALAVCARRRAGRASLLG